MTDHETVPVAGGRAEELLRRAGDVHHAPGPEVWAGIASGLARPRGPDRAAEAESSGPLDLDGARRGRAGGGSRARRGLQLLAAAAAGALVTWAGLELLDGADPEEVLARGDLAALGADGTTGRAEVVEIDGQQRLRVELDAVPDARDGYLEVWLLRPDVSGMVTLGVLDGTSAEFRLPAGLDLGEFAVVDISREHVDGDPGHGGDSLVRGEVG